MGSNLAAAGGRARLINPARLEGFMESEAGWFVLVEANDGMSEPRWRLEKKRHVPGDRTVALFWAEDICRTWCPRGWPEGGGRTVFQISESSWLVEVMYEKWSDSLGKGRAVTESAHFRVTLGRLVHSNDPPPAHPPKEPEKKAYTIRRAFGGGR
jgi:hypothetical protein